jgi:tripeptide aminopeptidase
LNDKRAIDLVMKLMAVPGKSCEEQLIADAIREVLREAGVADATMSFDSAHRKSPRSGQCGNLIVKVPGSRKLPRLMLSAHMDTVPVCLGSKPVRKGKAIRSADPKTGLGADDRAGCAAVLVSYLEALEAGIELPPLTLCFFVQEEIGLHGSRFATVSKLGKPDMALNFDGGNPSKMTVGATGGERMKIQLHGLNAHAGLAPEDGASALHAAGLAIASLVRQRWLGAVHKQGKRGTSNIGVVNGGVATNVVADQAVIEAEARSHDSAFRTAIADAIENAFVEAASKVKSKSGVAVRAEVERRVDYDSFRLPSKSAVVHLAADAIKSLGASPEQAVTNGGVDANWLVKHGIPTVTIGCGQRDVHTNKESLAIDDFLSACKIGTYVIENIGKIALA